MRPAVLGCLAALCGASAARADVVADCNQVRDPQLRLRACSEIMADSGYGANEKAIAYRNRGNARANAEALADFNQAVSLRPDEAVGFAGRARTRLAVQDIDGATADYGEVLRLAPGTVHNAFDHAQPSHRSRGYGRPHYLHPEPGRPLTKKD